MKKIVFFLMFISVTTISAFAETKTYVVKDGDTLSTICHTFLENGMMSTWKREAVRNSISNPHLIFPGQVLELPVIYRVSWKSTFTGYAAQGSWSLSEKNIIAWVVYGNKNFPGLLHKLEKR